MASQGQQLVEKLGDPRFYSWHLHKYYKALENSVDELSELTAPQPKAEYTRRKACLISQTTNTCGQKEQYFFSLLLQSRSKNTVSLAFSDLQNSLYLKDHSHAPSGHEMFINTNKPKDKF